MKQFVAQCNGCIQFAISNQMTLTVLLQMTWADIEIAQFFTWPRVMGIVIDYEKVPKLTALKDRVESSPKIAAWIAKRPDTPW